MVLEIISMMQKMWYSIATFVLSKIICIPFVRRPFQKLDIPDFYKVKNAVDVRIPVTSGSEIGAWFIRPCDKNMKASERYERILLEEIEIECGITELLTRKEKNRSRLIHTSHSSTHLTDEKETVILYLHGNAETRSLNHRVKLYQKFQELGLVVMAIDYRGYADSDGGFSFQTSERTMSEDAIATYNFLKSYIHPTSKIIVWGHSLGTGVTTKLGKETI